MMPQPAPNCPLTPAWPNHAPGALAGCTCPQPQPQARAWAALLHRAELAGVI
jgi:hypothetical protein